MTRPSSIAFLLLGCTAGIVLAAVGLLRVDPSHGPLPPQAIARVNGEILRRDDFLRVVNGVAQDRREGVGPEVAQRVLERMIDEELLLQRAIELGLARHDSRARKDLTAAVIESIVAEADDVEPTEEELQEFFRQQAASFAAPGRVRVRQIWLRAANVGEANAAFDRAHEAARRLRAGEDFAAVRESLGDDELAPLPDAPLPLSKLADYLGPTALRTVDGLKAGEVSDPVRSTSGYHVLQLVERQERGARTLEEIRPQVVQEFRRNLADRGLREYVADLRQRARIETAPLPR